MWFNISFTLNKLITRLFTDKLYSFNGACAFGKYKQFTLEGEMVSILSFHSDEPGLNPTQAHFLKELFWGFNLLGKL